MRPDRFATLGGREIGALSVWVGRECRELGELFEIQGERAARVHIAGDVGGVDRLGAGMTGGLLVVEGSAGHGVGLAMRGGAIHVLGSAGDEVGGAEPGASRGMTGGEIIIDGSVGANAGACARRGLIVVGGDTGTGAARGMIAGTLIVLGNAGRDAGAWNKRGTLLVIGTVDVSLTYRFACTYRPLFARLTLRSLRARYGLPIDEQWITGRYDRYSGDMAELGKGEILRWAAP